ncbi:unnamed protein product, partial [Protopolystoma xenopodis]
MDSMPGRADADFSFFSCQTLLRLVQTRITVSRSISQPTGVPADWPAAPPLLPFFMLFVFFRYFAPALSSSSQVELTLSLCVTIWPNDRFTRLGVPSFWTVARLASQALLLAGCLASPQEPGEGELSPQLRSSYILDDYSLDMLHAKTHFGNHMLSFLPPSTGFNPLTRLPHAPTGNISWTDQAGLEPGLSRAHFDASEARLPHDDESPGGQWFGPRAGLGLAYTNAEKSGGSDHTEVQSSRGTGLRDFDGQEAKVGGDGAIMTSSADSVSIEQSDVCRPAEIEEGIQCLSDPPASSY